MGGSELYVYDLASFLIENGHSVTVLTTNVHLGQKKKLPPNDIIGNIRICRFRVNLSSRFLTRPLISMYLPEESIRKEVERENFDILHFHNLTDFTLPVALWSISKPKIFTCHSLFEVSNYHHLIGPRKYFFKKILDHSDIVHVLSKVDELTLRNLGITSKIALIPPGLDFHYSILCQELVIPFYFVGRISPGEKFRASS